MTLVRRLVIMFALVLGTAGAAHAGAVTPLTGLKAPHVWRVQSNDIPDVVRLLAQRAARAERRGDMATANALYDTIREMGYVVRRRAPNRTQGQSSDGDGGGNGGGFSSGGFGGGRDDDDDDDDDDDGGGDDGGGGDDDDD